MVSEARQSHSLRILVEPSDYVLRNAGDMAMLRTAVLRLIKKWPNALIQVLSDEPDALLAFCPEVTPLPSAGRRCWLQMLRVPERFPNVVEQHGAEMVKALWRHKLRWQNRAAWTNLREFRKAVATADLVIV